MPSGPRVRTDNVFGTTTDNPLLIGATTMNSAGLANLAAVSSAHAIIILDPLRAAGAPEIIVVTAHTAAATSATITRAAYGSTARQHASGTLWVHAPTREDFIQILTSSTRPSDPYRGQLAFEADTGRWAARSITDTWLPSPHNPPACRVYHNATQSLTSGVEATLAFNSERFDNDTMHDLVTNNSRITFTTAGIYALTACVEVANATDYTFLFAALRVNGATQIDGAGAQMADAADLIPILKLSTLYKFAAADYVEVRVQQNNVAAAARNVTVNANRSPEFTAVWQGVG